ncbi:MAG TPA: tetratricopeptide repeat protein [Pyrinomonadaceae bacterium]|nr:tetratricopeptide repeat protein [Pyrinomonadaceae bacterium]
MNTQKLIYLAAGVLIGFAAGFIFTNGVNRKEHDRLRAEVAQLRGGNGGSGANRRDGGAPAPNSRGSSEQTLSDEEIRQKIAQADANPGDINFQRELSRGLFLYATNFERADLLPEIARLLKRAHDADASDEGVTVLLANTYFLMGQNGDAAHFGEARTYYSKVLKSKPGDAYLHTALGLAYFYDRPSDPKSAIREFRRSLASDPRHEMGLQGLAAALIASGETEEASRRLEELQSVNPSNAALPDLRAQLAQKTNAGGGPKQSN